MKKILSAVCAAALVLTAGSAFAAPKMQILGSLGIGYSDNSDIKDELMMLADDIEDTVPLESASVEHSNGNVGFNAEFRYFFNDNVGAGLSFGYYQASSSSLDAVFYDTYLNYYKCNVDVKFTVVPVLANIYYRANMENNNFLLLGAGLGFYRGRITIEEEIKSEHLLYSEEFDSTLKKNILGLQAMAEYDWVFDSGFTIFAGLKVRAANFKKLENNESYCNGNFTGAEIYIGAGASID